MLPGPDVVAGLLADERVATALAGARDDIDALLWRRDIRAAAGAVARSSIERGARASASIDGADIAVVDDSPMGRMLDRALAVTEQVPSQVDAWTQAPLQVLAHLHALVAAGFVDRDDLGRPRSTSEADDPLHIGAPPEVVGVDLAALARWLTASDPLPALLVAAIAHAELMRLRPFVWGSGLVARATIRCTLAARGLDPSIFSIPEHGLIEQGRPAYVAAIRSYATGTPRGVGDCVIWFATACGLGARSVDVPA